MKNYQDSYYALNRYSVNIVYRFADGIVEVTLEDYIAENPDKTEDDFRVLKKLSDSIYFEQDRDENAQTKKNYSFDELEGTSICYALSPEEHFIESIIAREEAERRQQCFVIANHALSKLTGAQRRRYLLHVIHGLTVREIAKRDGVTHQSVIESLVAADKKIKKVLEDLKKHPAKTP